jgi:FkbM family methyltransferase
MSDEPQVVHPAFNARGQRHEDVHARNALLELGIGPAKFVDIGAADGVTFSNTRAFYEQGWKGVVIEASPYAVRALLDLYGPDPEMVIVNAAVAQGDVSLGRFWASPDLVSTLSPKHKQTWEKTVPFREIYQPFVSIDAVVSFLVNQGGPYPLLSIDVEGHSVELFERLPLGALGVRVAVVEYDDKKDRLAGFARSLGFEAVEWTAENAVLVHKQAWQ